MGELIEVGGDLQGTFGTISALISVVALGLYALLGSNGQNNDDDDSTPGGGLMQPVA